MAKFAIEKKQILPTITLYIGFIAMAIFQGVIGATLPGLAENTASTLDEISILFSVLFLGYIIGSFFSGKLYDAFQPMQIIGISLLTGAIALVLIPTVHVRWLLAGVIFFQGLAAGSIDLGTNLTLIWIHGKKSGAFLNGLHAFFGIGSFFTPLIIGRMTTVTSGFRWAYWVLALIVLPIALLFFFLPPPRKEPGKAVNPEGTSPVNIQRTNHFKYTLLFSLVLLTVIGSGNSFAGWILTYTKTIFPNIPGQTAYQVSATFWITIAATRILTIPLIGKIRSHWILLFDITGFALSFSLLLIFPHSLAILWLAVALAGFSVATVFAAILVYCNRVCGMKGSSTRWLYLGSGLGNMTIPWLVGQLYENHGPAWMHIIHIGLVLLGLIFLFILIHLIQQKNITTGKTYES